jgi:hypothetical protein
MSMFDIFRSKRGVLNKRFHDTINLFLKVYDPEPTYNDHRYFATALDRASSILDDHEKYLSDAAEENKSFDLNSAIKLFKKGTQTPRDLSEKELDQFYEIFNLILKSFKRITMRSYVDRMSTALHVIFINIGVMLDKSLEEKYIKLWFFYKDCLPYCEDFKYKKHLPEELIKLVEKKVLNKK